MGWGSEGGGLHLLLVVLGAHLRFDLLQHFLRRRLD